MCAHECVCLCLFLEDNSQCILNVHEKSDVIRNADFALAGYENMKILLRKRM